VAASYASLAADGRVVRVPQRKSGRPPSSGNQTKPGLEFLAPGEVGLGTRWMLGGVRSHVVRCGLLAILPTGVPNTARLDQQELHFMLGEGLMLDALWYDEHLARSNSYRAIAEIDPQIALVHDERLVGVLVVMPDETALQFQTLN